MDGKLNMTLEDVIKQEKQGRGGKKSFGAPRRGRGNRRGNGGLGRGGLRSGGNNNNNNNSNNSNNNNSSNSNPNNNNNNNNQRSRSSGRGRSFSRPIRQSNRGSNRNANQKPRTGKGAGANEIRPSRQPRANLRPESQRFLKKTGGYRSQKPQGGGNNNNNNNNGNNNNNNQDNKQADNRANNRNQAPLRQNAAQQNTKLKVQGLHPGIVNSEIFDLFSQYGELEVCRIDFDRLGKSLGTAVIKYKRIEDARRAISDCNGAELDGHTLNVTYANVSFPNNQANRPKSFVPGVRRRGEFKNKQRRREERRGPNGGRGFRQNNNNN